MVCKFRLISDEVKGFSRDIELLDDQSFYDFHRAIIHELHYDKSQIASFFLTTSKWEKLQEFTLFDMAEGSVHPSVPMDKAILKDYLTEPKQRLLYVFDFFNERAIFIELMEMLPRQEKVGYPRVTASKGHPPAQLLFDAGSIEEPDFDE